MFILLPRLRIRISLFAIPFALLMLWCEGAIPFGILMLSACAHELGHLFMLWKNKKRYRRIDILPMGALIVCPEGLPDKTEFKIAVAGPVTSFLLGVMFLIGFFFAPSGAFLFATVVNFVLGIFNLLPMKKTDGGKALFCLFKQTKDEKTTERICSAVGVITKILFSVFVMLSLYYTGYNLGIVILISALMLQL